MDVPYDLSQRLLGHLPREVLEEMERRMGIAIERVSVQVEARALHHADAV